MVFYYYNGRLFTLPIKKVPLFTKRGLLKKKEADLRDFRGLGESSPFLRRKKGKKALCHNVKCSCNGTVILLWGKNVYNNNKRESSLTIEYVTMFYLIVMDLLKTEPCFPFSLLTG